jgi:hypothetical protein
MSETDSPDLIRLIGQLIGPVVRQLVAAELERQATERAPAPEMVTVQVYAARNALCCATVRQAFREGRLDGARVGPRAIRIRRDAVIRPRGPHLAPARPTAASVADRILGVRQ